MKIFGDFLKDKISPKTVKYFTRSEKEIVDKFVESIYKNFKNVKIKYNEQKKTYDQPDFTTEQISKSFNINKKLFTLNFSKFYSDNKKNWDYSTCGVQIGTWHTPKDDIYRNFYRQEPEFYSKYCIPPKQGKKILDFEEFKKINKIITGINFLYRSPFSKDELNITIQTKYENGSILVKDIKNEIIKKILPKFIKKIKKIKSKK